MGSPGLSPWRSANTCCRCFSHITPPAMSERSCGPGPHQSLVRPCSAFQPLSVQWLTGQPPTPHPRKKLAAVGEQLCNKSRGRPGRAGPWLGTGGGWGGGVRPVRHGPRGRGPVRLSRPAQCQPAAALAACQGPSLCAYRHVSRLSTVWGLPLHTGSLCAAGCVVACVWVRGLRGWSTAPPLIPPASLPYGALGVLAPRALSGLSLMCCLGSWGGKVRRKGLLSPRPGRFGRLQVDGVSFAGLRDRETQ